MHLQQLAWKVFESQRAEVTQGGRTRLRLKYWKAVGVPHKRMVLRTGAECVFAISYDHIL